MTTPIIQAPLGECGLFQPGRLIATTVLDVVSGTPPAAEARPKFTTVVETLPKGVEWILREFGPTTLVAIHPDSGAMRGFWLDETCVDRATRWAAERNGAGFNIYFTANLPRHGLREKADEGRH